MHAEIPFTINIELTHLFIAICSYNLPPRPDTCTHCACLGNVKRGTISKTNTDQHEDMMPTAVHHRRICLHPDFLGEVSKSEMHLVMGHATLTMPL